MNIPVPLPQGVTVNAQTLAQYNACLLPTGTFNGIAINGSQVPGIGQLVQTGPLSQTTFIPAANNTNNLVTIYACRPTVAPAWLNSILYPGNNVNIPGSSPAVGIPGAPEQYGNGNGPFGGPNVGGVAVGCSAAGDSLGGAAPPIRIAPSSVRVLCLAFRRSPARSLKLPALVQRCGYGGMCRPARSVSSGPALLVPAVRSSKTPRVLTLTSLALRASSPTS